DPERLVERTLDARAFALGSELYGGVRFVTYAVPGPVATTPQATLNAAFGTPPAIRLTGYALNTSEASPGDALGLTLFWSTDTPVDARLKVFVHLIGPDGKLVAQHDSEPANGLRPTDGWSTGETIADNHGLLIPPGAVPGTCRLVVGLYQFDGTRLPLMLAGTPAGDALTVQEIRIR
ncbi:MAG: hypothetical protein IT326_06640, partial [Anaerolineae bacterium]|nr:hypothetical protein [Anaerolineae bacterium]